MMPRPVYESLPVVYLAGGVTVMAVLESVFSVMSGVLLLAAGTLVFYMRGAYRHARRR